MLLTGMLLVFPENWQYLPREHKAKFFEQERAKFKRMEHCDKAKFVVKNNEIYLVCEGRNI